ncbi:DUF4406 domain-containing protein [Paenibacillus sinopodophylli]|uniref:DUF4406 domain-containing protein n=1 Tax=Paenibacillus sinopodophylli TaxID=1837342 RepID=UPI00110CB6AD|nr:DUF4406 domain-containing protein [Paenibacillus sinopodophylli]
MMNNSITSKVYIAGPMTGITDSNYPAFNKAAAEWEAKGYYTLNPVDNDDNSGNQTYADFIRAGLFQLLQADSIALLPGWENSKGAKLERHIAKILGLTIYEPVPPVRTWSAFLDEAIAVFITKNTDYDSRFMRALVHYNSIRGYEAARTIWAWEVEKKLDRCRTWIKRGELTVKGEGVRDSVVDLFNYTVQYHMFRHLTALQVGRRDPRDYLDKFSFALHATHIRADDWLYYLEKIEGLIGPNEAQLRDLLLEEMTGLPF